MKELLAVFVTIFIAELGDKTQLATLLFATDLSIGKWSVIIAASTALIASTLLAVIFGELITRVISPAALRIAAGVGFILIGAWTLVSSARH